MKFLSFLLLVAIVQINASEEDNEELPCLNRAIGDTLAHPGDEHKFLRCVSFDTLWIESCPSGLVYNKWLGLCDWNNDKPTTAAPTTPSTIVRRPFNPNGARMIKGADWLRQLTSTWPTVIHEMADSTMMMDKKVDEMKMDDSTEEMMMKDTTMMPPMWKESTPEMMKEKEIKMMMKDTTMMPPMWKESTPEMMMEDTTMMPPMNMDSTPEMMMKDSTMMPLFVEDSTMMPPMMKESTMMMMDPEMPETTPKMMEDGRVALSKDAMMKIKDMIKKVDTTPMMETTMMMPTTMETATAFMEKDGMWLDTTPSWLNEKEMKEDSMASTTPEFIADMPTEGKPVKPVVQMGKDAVKVLLSKETLDKISNLIKKHP